MLFPGHARPLTPELIAPLPSPPALVVPDGNWRQASRIVKRLPLLAGAVKASLPDRAFTGMAVRRNQEGHDMSIYEAVAQALGILEGEAVAGPLFDFYRRATDRMLLVRGKLQLCDVYGGLGTQSELGDEPMGQGGIKSLYRGTESMPFRAQTRYSVPSHDTVRGVRNARKYQRKGGFRLVVLA